MEGATPTIERAEPAVGGAAETGAATTLEQRLCEVLAEVLHAETVSPDGHFFDELGADSMVMAHFCARVRKLKDLPSITMKQVYASPTIRGLAAALAPAAPPPAAVTASSVAVAPKPQAPVELPEPIATWRYVLCGILQYLTGFVFVAGGSEAVVRAYAWTLAGSGPLDLYLRSLLVTTALLLTWIAVPIVVKWLLVGRWKPQKIRIWSLAYFRFWFVKAMIQSSPLALFPSPIFALYLRVLGAKIGRNVLFMTRSVPVFTDLLTIGDNAVIRKDSYVLCYRARAGWIESGPVRIGKDAVVGEMTVLDIDTSIGDGAQIGHSSSLLAGQSIPAGEHWHGSAARQTTAVDYAAVEPARCSLLRKTVYCLITMLPSFVLAPALMAIIAQIVVWLAGRPYFASLEAAAFGHHEFYRDALIASTALFLVGIILGLVSVVTIPRLLNRALQPDKAYPLYGFHYWVRGRISRLTNIRFFTYLFGDSSYIVYYLRAIGYDLSKVVQTGSNFGMDVKHDNPFLVTIGSGTMVADGLSSINTEYSSTSFRVARVRIGADNFLGNHVAYPSQGKTGDNCLLATRVMVPLDGEVRQGLGLLGSPSFEIPRTVNRDSRLSENFAGDELQRRLSRKNRHNLISMGLFLLVHWVHASLMLLLAFAVVEVFPAFRSAAIAVAVMVVPFLTVIYYSLVERASALFRALEPRTCSIYDPYFWFHERHWKLMTTNGQLRPFDGTPLKGLVWWLLGVRVGRRVFDDGCSIPEKTMVTIGDDCTLNQGCIIQPHSQEDGGFKSDRVRIGAGCTLGVAALVHYGVVMGDGAELAPNSFLMKGEEIPAGARWGENPARELDSECAVEAAPAITTPHPPIVDEVALANGGQEA
jgi:non-ribosomal peptide synthetase-like protein